jgi:hypothetical protein
VFTHPRRTQDIKVVAFLLNCDTETQGIQSTILTQGTLQIIEISSGFETQLLRSNGRIELLGSQRFGSCHGVSLYGLIRNRVSSSGMSYYFSTRIQAS